jgi:hypothetical protein
VGETYRCWRKIEFSWQNHSAILVFGDNLGSYTTSPPPLNPPPHSST